MRKNRVVGILALLVGCSTPGVARAPTISVRAPSPSPVQFAIDHSVFLSKSGCSAVAMGANRLVTAKHCIPDDAKAGDPYEGGELTYISPSYDFAVVKVPDARLAIAIHTGVIGERVYVVGYPVQLGSEKQELTVTDGLVAGPTDHEGQMRITAPVYFGNSGGGVWSDRGELVGIAVSIYAVHVENYEHSVPYVAQSFMVPVALIEGYLL